MSGNNKYNEKNVKRNNQRNKKQNYRNQGNQNNQKKNRYSRNNQSQNRSSFKSKRVFYENDYIYNCDECNVPLIGSVCGICEKNGRKIVLSQPSDVRFSHEYDDKMISKLIVDTFSCNPLENQLLLLNKIPGDDRAFEVIVNGEVYGYVRFDLEKQKHTFEPTVKLAGILLSDKYKEKTKPHTVKLERMKGHLNGKKANKRNLETESESFESFFSENIKKDDIVLIEVGNSFGYGTALVSGNDLKTVSEDEAVIRIKTVSNENPDNLLKKLPDKKTGREEIVKANLRYVRELGKTAINTIRGFVNQEQNIKTPVYVSFSGGKDSLVCFDLTRSALKNREFKPIFLNTGIDFPETVEFVHSFCKENEIDLIELKAGDAFWNELEKSGHPTKDERWCCSVCKLNSANEFHKEKEHIAIDGKRRHESFNRATIPTTDKNPQIPGQTNLFPIKDWKALEVWIYIYWRQLKYNPLYEEGFERVGCMMCPAAFEAEYKRTQEIHPEIMEKWEDYLKVWAKKENLPEEHIKYGFWRWKQLPPKMLLIKENINK